ncbi:hypothetical protein LTR56_007703 [Elasticomyces elasticus]|nr:hypothetical protein LTR56_007703 [Elasticomyces elasticus]KAK3661925.1 hypothetical protein LTR22_007299 [Elasticomyces elasticus]KAK4925562.1 hypothetical protein LTR49_007400 [Elasticomyces elasticus]KAK5759840.1 hypothetical protein LTS12_010027 [Elasticomyces elasticus]
MHILVLGGTGLSGTVFIEEALQSGHTITIYARNPGKLSQHLRQHDNLAVVEGTFDDMDAARRALHCGAEALVSFAGPTMPSRGTAVADFYDKLFPLLEKSPIDRIMILSTASFRTPGDGASWLWWLGGWCIWTIGGSTYQEMNRIGQATTRLPMDQVEWTLYRYGVLDLWPVTKSDADILGFIRVPFLTNSKSTTVQTGMVGSGTDGMLLSRSSLSVWILQELQDRKYIGKTPMVSNPGWF